MLSQQFLGTLGCDQSLTKFRHRTLVRVRFLVMKMFRISDCLYRSPGKCVNSTGASTEKLLWISSLKRDVPLEFLERQPQASCLK